MRPFASLPIKPRVTTGPSAARRQLLLGQFGDGGDVRFGAAKAIVSAQHFTGVKPLRLNTAFTQNFHKQQGRHQFAMADQFVSQGG